MNVQPFLIGEGWIEVRDGNDTARDLFRRHYSCKKEGPAVGADSLMLGPGDKMVLLTPDGCAVFAWRRERDEYRRDGQRGVECTIFRNEGAWLSSGLIIAAQAEADRRWPGERHFTHVDPEAVRGTCPGYCFIRAGWRNCGVTKVNRHRILHSLAEWRS